MNVVVTCDRCGVNVEGLLTFDYAGPCKNPTVQATGGFYLVKNPAWAKYANEGEAVVCDTCMWRDERYLADYPHMRGRA